MSHLFWTPLDGTKCRKALPLSRSTLIRRLELFSFLRKSWPPLALESTKKKRSLCQPSQKVLSSIHLCSLWSLAIFSGERVGDGPAITVANARPIVTRQRRFMFVYWRMFIFFYCLAWSSTLAVKLGNADGGRVKSSVTTSSKMRAFSLSNWNRIDRGASCQRPNEDATIFFFSNKIKGIQVKKINSQRELRLMLANVRESNVFILLSLSLSLASKSF